MDSWLVERAREELEMLESKHPTRFNYLKLELKSFISQPNCVVAAVDDDVFLAPPSSAALTQVSSNRKRKIKWSDDVDGDEYSNRHQKNKAQKSTSSSSSAAGERGGGESCKKSDSSMEAAIKKAEACLERIQQVKQSLFCSLK